MKSHASLLAVWIVIAAFGVACWIGLFYLGAVVVHAWGTWPIVRLALTLGALGAALFALSEQYGEFGVKYDDRTGLQHRAEAWKPKAGDGIQPLRRRFP